MARTRPCTRPVYGAVYAPCTRPKTSVQSVYTVMYTGGVDGWRRRAMCTAHRRPCTGRVYGTAVIRPCTGRFRGRRRVHGPCTRPPCNGHTTRHVSTCTMNHGRVHDTLHGSVYGPYAAAQRPWTARTRTCHCRVDFPCTPYARRCNVCVHVSPAHGPCTRTWTGRVDGPCIRLPTWPLCLHGPYTAIIPRQDNTHFIPFTCTIFHL